MGNARRHIAPALFESLPRERTFRFTLYGSAPLQLTLDRTWLSADVDLFSSDDEDLTEWVRRAGLAKDAFRMVVRLTGHPATDEFKRELQNAVDLFRPSFDDESPERYSVNTHRLWRELFGAEIDIRTEIIALALARAARWLWRASA